MVAGGDNEIVIVDAENGNIERRIDPGAMIGALSNPSWSPDGRYIAFSGSVEGISDLFVYDLEADETRRLTDDKYADLQPSWSPDGRTIAFTSDRGPETDFEVLTYSAFQLATIDVATRQVEHDPRVREREAHQPAVLGRRLGALLHLRPGRLQRHLRAGPPQQRRCGGSPTSRPA